MIRVAAAQAVFVGATATFALAQDLPSLNNLLAPLAGQEVQASGTLTGASIGDNKTIYMFKLDGKGDPFDVTFAVDRATLKSTDVCDMFNGCKIDISAELQVSGGQMGLIIFDVRNLAKN